jgi:hypothetical protein
LSHPVLYIPSAAEIAPLITKESITQMLYLKTIFNADLCNPTELSPHKANSSSASQAISNILCNLTVHYNVHKTPPPVPIISQMNPVHASPTHFANTPLNAILPSMSRSSEWILDLRFPTESLCGLTFCPMRATRRAHLIILDFIIQVISDEDYKL